MPEYFTTGQAAKNLRISTSSLKKALKENPEQFENRKNQFGWRLLSKDDLVKLKALTSKTRRRWRAMTDEGWKTNG